MNLPKITIDLKAKTVKPPKWFLSQHKLADEIVEEELNKYGRSVSWFSNTKQEGRREFLHSLNSDEKRRINEALEVSNSIHRAKWLLFAFEKGIPLNHHCMYQDGKITIYPPLQWKVKEFINQLEKLTGFRFDWKVRVRE